VKKNERNEVNMLSTDNNDTSKNDRDDINNDSIPNQMGRKRLSIKEHFKNAVAAVYSTFLRFPMTIMVFIALAVFIIYRIEMPYERIRDIQSTLDRINFILIMGIPFSMCISLSIEKFKIKADLIFKVVMYVGGLVLLILYFFILLQNIDMVTAVRCGIIIGSLTLAFMIIPYLNGKDNFEVYITKLLTGATVTAFFTVVLGGGLSIILFAVKALLISDLNTNFFAYSWILSWLIFAPFHFLYGFPEKEEVFSVEQYNRVLKVLLMYIVLPLVSVFTLVLYIYFAKIIITQVWPQGIVTYLVISYAAVGAAVIFIAAPLGVQNRWVKIFSSVFTKIIFPLLAMMFVSIFIRIGDYGLTENRYFVLVIGVWATFAMIFINLDKGKRNIFLPISLVIILLLSVAGPWDAFNVSRISQNNRFKSIMTKYNMLENNKIVLSKSEVSSTDKEEITSILNYFNGPHKFSELKYLPEGFDMAKMKSIFGFDQVYPNVIGNETGFGYYNSGINALEISGYDVLFKCNSYSYDNGKLFFQQSINSRMGVIKLSVDGNILSLLRDGMEIYSYDMDKYVQSLYNKYGAYQKENKDASEGLTFKNSNSKAQVMITFENINGNINSDGTQVKIDSFNASVFVKIE
jgi:hypothetical protein